MPVEFACGPGGHRPALDGLRGLAIAVVVASHFQTFLSPDGAEGLARTVARVGYLGVDLFFVLSGFLITGILVDTKGLSRSLPHFFLRRAVRIFPLYYAYLAMVFSLLRSGGSPTGIIPSHYFFYLQNLKPHFGAIHILTSHLWSLAVEEQFYLVWPLVVYFCPRPRLAGICLAGAAGAVLIRAWLAAQGVDPEIAHQVTPARLDTLLLGAAGALVARDARLARLARPALTPAGIAATGVAIAVAAARGGFSPADPVVYTVGWSASAVAFACLVYRAGTDWAGARPLCLAPLCVLGKYSYGIYMLHVLPMAFVLALAPRDTPAQRAGAVAMACVVTAALAALSWVALERPFLRLKRYFPAASPHRMPG
jgi:peptidoglycan/LPS O-acetylase OafA/YrhL